MITLWFRSGKRRKFRAADRIDWRAHSGYMYVHLYAEDGRFLGSYKVKGFTDTDGTYWSVPKVC